MATLGTLEWSIANCVLRIQEHLIQAFIHSKNMAINIRLSGENQDRKIDKFYFNIHI